MNISSQKKMVGDLVMSLISDRKDADVLFVGSLRAAAEQVYHPALSDIDVLIVPKCDSLGDYVSHFERAMEIASLLNRQEGWLADVFLMSHDIAAAHYSCLAIYAGDTLAREIDFIANNGHLASSLGSPDVRFKRKLYAGYAKRLCDHYKYALPVVDTRYAKQTAKRLLRIMKLIVCAHTDAEELNRVESILFEMSDFSLILPLFRSVTGYDLQLRTELDQSLRSAEIDNWPALMEEQYAVARALSSVDFSDILSESEVVIYGDAGYLLRNLLLVDLKNILVEADLDERARKIEKYINDGSSVIVRLALSGVEELADMTTANTPKIVQESYEIITDYLQGGEVTQKHVAAMTVMLEYAFSRVFRYCHHAL